MLEQLRAAFENEELLVFDKSGVPAERDLQVAVALILLEVAGPEPSADPAELNAIMTNVGLQFGLSTSVTAELLELAATMIGQRERLTRLINLINERFDDQQRLTILELAWKVIKSDGGVTDVESRFAADLRHKLKLSLEQAAFARRLAE